MVLVLCRYLWSLASRWLKAICQFDPPVETRVLVIYKARLHYVATIWPNQCHLAQKPKRIIYRYTVGKIDKFTVQFVSWSLARTFLTGGTCGFSSVLKWLAVPLPLHSPQQCMFLFFFACLLLLPSPEAHIKWFLHVVSQEAAKSRVENVRAFARDLHAVGLFFWFNSEKARVKYCLAQHLWKKGPNRWSERQIGR